MERTQPAEILRACLLQRDVIAHDADDVRLLLHRICEIAGLRHAALILDCAGRIGKEERLWKSGQTVEKRVRSLLQTRRKLTGQAPAWAFRRRKQGLLAARWHPARCPGSCSSWGAQISQMRSKGYRKGCKGKG